MLLKLLEKREKVDEDAAEGGRLDGGDLGSEDAFSGEDLGCLNDSAFWSLLHEPDILSFSSFDRKRERERRRIDVRVWVFKWKKNNERELEKKRGKRRGKKRRKKKQENFRISKL